FADADALGLELLSQTSDPDPQVRLQLAYTLGALDEPGAGEALGKMAVQNAGDIYITAAVMSSVTSKNLDRVLLGALKPGKAAPPAATLARLPRLAEAFGNKNALATLLQTVAKSDKKGQFAPWQYATMARFFEALERRGSSIMALNEVEGKEIRTAMKSVR